MVKQSLNGKDSYAIVRWTKQCVSYEHEGVLVFPHGTISDKPDRYVESIQTSLPRGEKQNADTIYNSI